MWRYLPNVGCNYIFVPWNFSTRISPPSPLSLVRDGFATFSNAFLTATNLSTQVQTQNATPHGLNFEFEPANQILTRNETTNQQNDCQPLFQQIIDDCITGDVRSKNGANQNASLLLDIAQEHCVTKVGHVDISTFCQNSSKPASELETGKAIGSHCPNNLVDKKKPLELKKYKQFPRKRPTHHRLPQRLWYHRKGIQNLIDGSVSSDCPPSFHVGSKKRKAFKPCRSPPQDDPSFRGVSIMIRSIKISGQVNLDVTGQFHNLQPKCIRRHVTTEYFDSQSESEVDECSSRSCGSQVKCLAPTFFRKANNNMKQCASCGTRKTPLWRDAEDGTPLCNACGIRYKKYRIRCVHCWNIPRKETKPVWRCYKCGQMLKPFQQGISLNFHKQLLRKKL